MAKYFVNNIATKKGDHEVHVETCPYMPADVNSLGSFSSCQVALAAARYFYHSANGCYWCCRKCHTVSE